MAICLRFIATSWIEEHHSKLYKIYESFCTYKFGKFLHRLEILNNTIPSINTTNAYWQSIFKEFSLQLQTNSRKKIFSNREDKELTPCWAC